MRDPTAYSRRVFLQQGVTLASTVATVPWFIERSAHGVMHPLGCAVSSRPGINDERILVVVQLGGGNDGLNTVVPYFDNRYYAARSTLAIGPPGQARQGAGAALELDEDAGLGLHPALSGLKELYDDSKVSVIQGVGYPNPNRSHFASMDIWQTGRTDGKGTGWIGRYFDNTCNGSPDPQGAVAIGRQAPLALMGDVQKPVAFENAGLFRWTGQDLHAALGEPYDAIVRAGALEGVDANSQQSYLMRTSLDAQVASDRIRTAVAKRTLVNYPGNRLANQLKMIGAMIRDGLSTRVYYASLGGFDTHGSQLGSHNNLMNQLGSSLKAFQADLAAQGNEDRVLTVVFSEFGRRVAQNGSGGTDHGTAAPMFLVGSKVRPGILGNHPSLGDLDRGDLKFGIDFRSVYAGILGDWMQADSDAILGERFRRAQLLKT